MRPKTFTVAVAAFAAVLAGSPGPVRAQAAGSRAVPAPAAAGRPTELELQAVTDAGRRIAAYREGVAGCRAALAQKQPDQAETRAVAVDRNGVMHVFFLRREQVGQETRGWVPVADATWQPRAGEVASLVMLDASKAPPADVIGHLRALDAARAAATTRAGAPPSPYDEAVFKEKGSTGYTVYLQTRPERPDAARFGSDARVRVSGDGLQPGDIVALHDATVTVAVPARAGSSPTLHAHEKGDLPTETDVAVVLLNPGLAPHLVLTPRHMFRIEADGRIAYLGPNAASAGPTGGS